MNYWISWWHTEDMGELELHTPWWVSGERADGAKSVCAAVRAPDDAPWAAEEIIYAAYDDRPEKIEFRFAEMKPEGWSPFGSRFQRADWMQWPDA